MPPLAFIFVMVVTAIICIPLIINQRQRYVRKTFYIFIADGSSVFDMARGAIVSSVKNEDLWYDNLIGAYPFSDEMRKIIINDDCWNHPDPGLIIQGEKINFKPYIDAIRKHLIEQMTLSPEQAEKALSLFISYNIGTADYYNGRLAFGVPVEL